MRLLVVSALVALAASVSACEESYVYRPLVSTTSATIEGLPASYYGVPPEAPTGDVRVAVIGFADIRPSGVPAAVRAVHVRMIVANDSDGAWTVDTREQHVALPNFGESRPAYAQVDQGSAPVVSVPPRGVRTIDLYYPLPQTMQEAKEVPAFDVLWQVDTNTRRVVERTPFERVEVEPAAEGYPYPEDYPFYGPYWYDPYYHSGAWVGVGLGPSYLSRPVHIRHHVYHAAPTPRFHAPPAAHPPRGRR